MSDTRDGPELPGNSGLSWGLRASFVEYVVGSGGTIVATDGAVASPAGLGSWLLADASGFDAERSEGMLQFSGQLRYSAHFGALDVVVREPRIDIHDGVGTLSASTDAGPMSFASFRTRQVGAASGYRAWVGEDGALSAEATVLFGGSYGAGAAMDPFIVVLLGDS